jgi:hypothetical protein
MLRRRRLEVKESAVILVSVISMRLASGDVGKWLIELRECLKLLKWSAIFGRY